MNSLLLSSTHVKDKIILVYIFIYSVFSRISFGAGDFLMVYYKRTESMLLCRIYVGYVIYVSYKHAEEKILIFMLFKWITEIF